MRLGFIYAFVALLAIFRVEPSEGFLDINNELNNIISPPILPAVESILDIYGDTDSTEDEQKVRLQRESIVKNNGLVFKLHPIVLGSNASNKPSFESEAQAQSFSQALEEAKLQIQRQSQSQSQAQGLGLDQSQQQIQTARTKVQEQFQSQERGRAQSQQQDQIQQSRNQAGAKLREKMVPYIQTLPQIDANEPESAEAEAEGGLSGNIALVPPIEEEDRKQDQARSQILDEAEGIRQSLAQTEGQSQSQDQVQSQAEAINRDIAEYQDQAESRAQEQSQAQAQSQDQSQTLKEGGLPQSSSQQSLVQAEDDAQEDPIDESLHQAQSEVLKQVNSQTNGQLQAQAQTQAQVLDQALEDAHVQYQSQSQSQGISLSQPTQQSLVEPDDQAKEDPVDQSLHQAQSEILKQLLSQKNDQFTAQAQTQAQTLDEALEEAHVEYQSQTQAQGTPLSQPEDRDQDTALDQSPTRAQSQSQEQTNSKLQRQSQGQSDARGIGFSALGQAQTHQQYQSQAQSPQHEQLQSDDQSGDQAGDEAQDTDLDQSLHKAQAEVQEQLQSQTQASGPSLTQSQQQSQAQEVEALAQSLTQAHAQVQEQAQSQSQGPAISQAPNERHGQLQSEREDQDQSRDRLQGPKYDDDSYSQPKPRSCLQCQQATYPQFIAEVDIEIDAKLDTPKLISKYGHQAETHYAFTADGYKLCLHRIPRSGATPVLLVHGLMASSATWVQFGPSQGLAYILSQSGYDVWMLNTRGNVYSEERLAGRESDKVFWDFSFHEIGQYDLPAAIDLILLQTKMPSIQYIGHSQGSTAFFVMCSERPEYAGKITLMQSLSPSVYMEETRSPALKFMKVLQGGFTMLLNLLGGHKISLNNRIVELFRNHICNKLIPSRICAIFEFVVCGFNFNSFNMTLSPILEGHASQGSSAKQIYHFAQLQGKSEFQKYDYGLILNKLRYKSIFPPTYNLSLALGKVALHRGDGDWLGSESDVLRLERDLPNCIENRNIRFEGFSHFDFTISKDVRSLVYDRVISLCGSN
ncbi:GD23718 [Drosophila simulans]|uniref:GD23718 n=1 Tax=Drosophila simulans TaxID=7240 RepID=B4Q9D4_DROSI|nr:GD23718 [Drosophila simulans]